MIVGLAALAAAATGQVSLERYADGGWTLTLRRDAFASTTTCRLESRKPRMIYRAHALGFSFGSRANVADAWYRIDAEAPVRWSDRLPNLIHAGVPVDLGGLENPTAGLIWVTARELASAQEIVIRSRDGGRLHRFKLGGFERMYAAARRLGCASDVDFVG